MDPDKDGIEDSEQTDTDIDSGSKAPVDNISLDQDQDNAQEHSSKPDPGVDEVTEESPEENTSTPQPNTPKDKEEPAEPLEEEKVVPTRDESKSSETPETTEEEKKPEEQENPDFKYIIRVANTNLDGNATIPQGLTSIKGVGIRIATVITDLLKLPRTKKIGDLTDEEVESLIQLVDNLNNEIPEWMMNRQKDFDSGEDFHMISSETQRSLRDDLNRMKKIRCYRGIRHEQGQKVRGQRTRSNGRTGMTVGVVRKKVQQPQKKEKK